MGNRTPEQEFQEIAIKEDTPEANEIRVLLKQISYQGPLPPAEQFRIYNESVPGAGEQIIKYMMDGQAHRHMMEKESLHVQSREALIGQFMAFIIMITLIVAALWAGFSGNNILAGILFAAFISNIIGKFIDGRKH